MGLGKYLYMYTRATLALKEKGLKRGVFSGGFSLEEEVQSTILSTYGVRILSLTSTAVCQMQFMGL